MPRFVGRSADSHESRAPPPSSTPSPPPPSSSNAPSPPLPSSALVPKVTRAKPARRRFISQIPPSISENARLVHAMQALPDNYNFEIFKTIWRIRQMRARNVALQFPEGLLLYACTIADIIGEFGLEGEGGEKGEKCEVVIMGDVTYGACCVDDLTAASLGCELLVHYGHSCLVPIDRCATDVMYVFVEVGIDTAHLLDTIKLNFEPTTRLALCGTIQFGGALHSAASALRKNYARVLTPQAKPLSAGEVLGCTAPKIEDCDVCIFIADGRFHPEAVMVANPQLPLYRYDPYSKAITRERYEHEQMHTLRRDAIEKARPARQWGIVMGTLGRQGNPDVLYHLQRLLQVRGMSYTTVLLSEVFPAKLAAFPSVEAWIQVCCPRLSMDWGHHFSKPLLSPYEAEVALAARAWLPEYPMDNYAKAGGSYSNYATEEARAKCQEDCRCHYEEGGEGVNPRRDTPPTDQPPTDQDPSCPSPADLMVPTPKQSEEGVVTPLKDCGTVSAEHGGRPAVVVVTLGQSKGTAERWLPQCVTLEKKCFAKHEAMDIAAELKNRSTTLFCAAFPGAETECVGYCITQRSSLAVNIVKLLVAPLARRQGVGRALLRHAVDAARSARAQICVLNVDTENEPAKQLYISLGFKITGRREDYYKPGRHAYALELALIT